MSSKSSISDNQRVVITGMGICSPCGGSIAEFAEVLRNGKTGIRKHSGLLQDKDVWAGLVEDFQPESHFSEIELEEFDRTAQMGYLAAKQAVDDAAFSLQVHSARTALTLGTSHGGRSQFDRFVMDGSDADSADAPNRLLKTAAHYQQTAAVSCKLGVHGPTATLSNACSSSGAAIAYAIELLRSGKCDFAIAGGADGFSRLTYSGFSALGAVSDGPCAPFSEPVGLSLGDGAAFVVLETLEQAEERSAKIYAEIWGYGLSWDAYHITAPEPSGEGMNRAIHMAAQNAGIKRETIDYVNVHGTGTRSNDLAETVGLLRYFEGSPPPVSATKSQTGHMLGASSTVGVISCIIGMSQNWLPPTSNFTTVRSGCELDVVPNQSRPQEWSCFMAQSAAFAGANAVIIGGKPNRNRMQQLFPDDEIVISGIGIVSPIGFGFDAYCKSVREGISGIVPITEFDTSECRCRVAGMVRDFLPRKLMPSINLRRVDRVAAFATIAASMALQDAKRWPLQANAERTGLVVGVCRGAAASYEKYLASVADCQWDKASAIYFPNLVMSSVGGQVSASLGIKGITSSLVGGTAAGLQSLVHAWELFRRNPTQDSVVVLAADELAPFYYRLFDRGGKLASSQPNDQSNAHRYFAPYDPDGDGMVLGEGSASFVLERASSVRARGGRIYATLQGSGLTNNASASSLDKDSHQWLSTAMEIAVVEAGLVKDQIQFHYGSGRGIAEFDAHELAASRQVFGDRLMPTNVNHLTGVAEATSSLFQVAAAIANSNSEQAAGELTHALISATGDDGANAAVVMEMGR